MGLDDFKNKDEKDYTAEDWLCNECDLQPGHPFYWKLWFNYGEYRFVIWEDFDVYQYYKDDVEESAPLAHKQYEYLDDMMLDKFWQGLSLSDIMSTIPESAIHNPY
ncbi:MAG: hypothetical protein IKS45_05460 [Thermoguttaceae bacterium]|nr:hypothetical protein [Thermoguttaceae bacterium]